MTDEPARARDDAAAEWAVRLEEHGDDPATLAARDAWLAQDARRAGALLRAEAALSLLNRGRALRDERPAPAPVLTRRRLVLGGAGAALAASGAALFLNMGWHRFGTALGEVRKAPLPDGSMAAINTASEIEVRMRPNGRQVKLAKGEVWFKVAHDPSRPFVVEAGDVRVRAVGTAFSVRRRGEGADVLVTEGVVETWVEGGGAAPVRMVAGSRAFVSAGQPAQPVAASAEIDNALAWREGQIALYGETLADAAAEFNRYNARKLVIADPTLAGERLVGQFHTDEPEAFARAAATTLGARMSADATTIRLERVTRP